ncbi:hypothetical protein AKJ37_03920 [candidate division MSBL1 archaeon SCGC-AAA259I09]|uniref:Acyl-CoA dehydrogenase n=1 Tax=candidate division MSBL1 archaeon SCGC-AAA259I09 TaxID=1698267 RepID=A0A133USB5_9EURY|nr:hypothetical protein AKJ37_03920 [candidate division MSBL1 archaeon SCGC-AAA259I09]
MVIELTETQELTQESVREFAEKEIEPAIDEMEEKGYIPDALWRKIGKQGIFGIRYSEEYGGSNLDVVSECLVAEEIAKVSLSVAFETTMQFFQSTDFIAKYGSEEQKEKWLVPAIKGEVRGAFCLTEPGGGSDLSHLSAQMEKDGDEAVINGKKTWTTSGPMADYYIVGALTDPEKGARSIDWVVIDSDNPGVEIGKDIPKIGLKGTQHSEVFFNDCRVPVENALAGIGEGNGYPYLNGILAEIRVVTAALGLGLTRAALDDSMDFAKQRVAFGKAIAKRQGISFKITDIATRLNAARLLTYRVASIMDEKGRNAEECSKLAPMTKNFSCKLAQDAVDKARRIQGAASFSSESSIGRYFCDSGALLWGGGTREINNWIIARELGLFD